MAEDKKVAIEVEVKGSEQSIESIKIPPFLTSLFTSTFK